MGAQIYSTMSWTTFR